MSNSIRKTEAAQSTTSSDHQNENYKRPEILIKLKKETDSLHHKLQENKIFEGLFSQNPLIEKYKNLLKKFLGFYLQVEESLAKRNEWATYSFNFSSRRKASLIEKDLRSLGLPENELASTLLCPELPTINTFSQALGCMYVLEGATLGAQLLAKNLNQTVGMNESNGCAFLKCYGENVGPMFKAFGEFLGQHTNNLAEDEVIQSAKETFLRLDKWLSSE